MKLIYLFSVIDTWYESWTYILLASFWFNWVLEIMHDVHSGNWNFCLHYLNKELFESCNHNKWWTKYNLGICSTELLTFLDSAKVFFHLLSTISPYNSSSHDVLISLSWMTKKILFFERFKLFFCHCICLFFVFN